MYACKYVHHMLSQNLGHQASRVPSLQREIILEAQTNIFLKGFISGRFAMNIVSDRTCQEFEVNNLYECWLGVGASHS
jgi:hypothetical protein